MNNVVLKGKLGAGFNDDRYTLPKDGNPGDILVKTETGSAWEKHEQGSGGRFIVNWKLVEYNGRNRIMLDKTVKQISETYNSGKTVVLDFGATFGGSTVLTYNGSSFYIIMPTEASSLGISKIGITIVGNPLKPDIDWTQSDELWDFAEISLSTTET